MGNCFGFRRRRLRRHIVLILIGLDNAGKTQTVNNLAGEKDDKVLPTVGFKAVNLVHKDTPVTIYDLGGGPHFRQIWPQYYSEVHGVIFVIDSSDFSRLDECKAVLEEVLSHDKISGKPVLVLANKQDKTGALDDIDVVEKLNIEPLVNRYRCPTLVESYSASPEANTKKPKIDPGLRKGYHWLLNYIVKRYGDINLRVQTDIHAELERRKRLMNRASNRASQTFTAFSDDIATQTGFENPNFDPQKTPKTSANDTRNLIHVKPIKNPNSLDSTITIESVEESEDTSAKPKSEEFSRSNPSEESEDASAKPNFDFNRSNTSETSGVKPKLSPLFGRASNTSTSETVRVELEPRNEFRKLSPIVRKKSGVNHIDFNNKPQSSPTYNGNKTSQSSQNSSIVEEPKDASSYLDDGALTPLDKWGPGRDLKHRVLVNDADLALMHREIVLTEREHANKATSDIARGASGATLPLSARPASASQLLRRQLEICPAQHKRRLSLRYMQRNKTSPERNTMLLYEPKAPRRHLDKGDFEHATIR